jgi:hypothetical protein
MYLLPYRFGPDMIHKVLMIFIRPLEIVTFT